MMIAFLPQKPSQVGVLPTYQLVIFLNCFKHIYFNFPQAGQEGRLEKREINELTLMFFNYIVWNPESQNNSQLFFHSIFQYEDRAYVMLPILYHFKSKNVNFQTFKLHSHLNFLNICILQRTKKNTRKWYELSTITISCFFHFLFSFI